MNEWVTIIVAFIFGAGGLEIYKRYFDITQSDKERLWSRIGALEEQIKNMDQLLEKSEQK